MTESFELAKGSKEVLIDPRSTEGKMVRIGTTLSSESESALIGFLHANRDIFVWKPSDMPGILREVTKQP